MIKNIFHAIYKFINKNCYIAILFSWLYTGFGQFYNKQYLKGILFGVFNFLNNQNGHLNQAMLYSFSGEIEKAKLVINYQWILNYPACFAYSHWDAYKFGYKRDHDENPPISHSIPFILSAMFATVGIVYGRKNPLGPIFMGLGCHFLGLLVGAIIVKISKG